MGPVGDLIFVIVVECLFGFLTIFAWWGWRKNPQALKTKTERVFTLVTLVLASFSACLEIGSAVYAHIIGGFRFYDPTLMLIYGFGLLSAILGFFASGLAKGPGRNRSIVLCILLAAVWIFSMLGE